MKGISCCWLFVAFIVGMACWPTFVAANPLAIFAADPDDVALGADLTTTFPGVTLSVEEFPDIPVIAGSGMDGGNQLASTGSQVFARQQTQDNAGYWQRVAVPGLGSLRIEFAFPTDFVSIDMIGPDDSVGELQVFDVNGLLLETFTTEQFPKFAIVTAHITRPTADIASAIVGGIPGEGLLLDNLRFNGYPYLVALQASLAQVTVDADHDGLPDLYDHCPGTAPGEVIDNAGCSSMQFCSAIDATTPQGARICKRSDWRNDEPLMKASEADCRVNVAGPGRADDRCGT